MSMIIVLKQMLILFAMMAVGMLFGQKGWIDDSGQKAISKLVVNVFNPLLIIYSISGYDFENATMNVGQNVLFVGIYYLMLFVLGIVVTRILGIKYPQRNFYQMMMMFSNIIFIGIPIITALLGKEYVLYIAFYTLAYNVLIYTYGIYLAIKTHNDAEGNSIQFPWKKILNPGVFGCLIAIMIFAFKIKLAEPITMFLDYMGSTCIPLSMILIGVSVSRIEAKKLFANVKMYVFLLIKLLVIPITAALICRNLPIDEGVYKVFIIECAVPVGSIITLLAQEYGVEDDSSTVGIVLSTLMSVITIPIVALFL